MTQISLIILLVQSSNQTKLFSRNLRNLLITCCIAFLLTHVFNFPDYLINLLFFNLPFASTTLLLKQKKGKKI